jgi:multiple sugar transport system substrate-binding protein
VIRSRLVIALAAVAALVLSGCGGKADNASGPTEIAVWNGFTDASATNFAALIDRYNKDHPDVRVTQLMTSNDLVLQKVLTAVRGGSPPDVAYMYGSWAPNIAEIPTVTDLSGHVSEPGWNWDDFYPAERAAATVGDKIVGVPALVDNLAVVYNKTLFAEAGIAPPTKDWTWDDFRAAAAKLTNSKGQYGTLISGDASEDTVWHYLPMLWGAGGDVLSPDNQRAVFNSAAGVRALTTLQQMAVTDKSIYVDATNANGVNLMNSGKIGMLVTGPWDLPSFTDIEYGVQVLPAYPDGAGHQTISGPDNWVIFNNGSERQKAALDFVKWVTAAPQVQSTSAATGELPTRASVGEDPALVAELTQQVPGTETFIENLSNVKKARPTVPQYPTISQALGQAIVSVLLGTAQPADALNTAAQAADAALAGK